MLANVNSHFRGRVRNFNPRVPLITESMSERVPLVIRDQNFAGAIYGNLKFYGCLAPVAPVLTRPLIFQQISSRYANLGRYV